MDREEDCKWGYGLDDQIRADRLPDTEILPEGMKKVRREDPEYPGRLRNIPDPPKQLYYYGELPGEDEPSAAIIGARDCSEYGKYVAIELGRLLGQNGICVISGMARGIDGISQEAALSVGGRSYGVLGSGADVCYPRSNRGLYEQLKCRGGVLSEYAPGTPAKGYLFPPRNRIVSGLADVVVVVEAREKSGTLITVDMALEQGKDVYMVPGRVTDKLSEGCNRLIKAGAGILVSPEDFVKELWGDSKVISPKREKLLSGELGDVYNALDFTPSTVEQVWAKLGGVYTEIQVASLLMQLSMQKEILQVSPGYFRHKG